MIRYISPITIEYTPTETDHAVSVGYVAGAITEYDVEIKGYCNATYAVIDHTHDGTYATPADVNLSIETALDTVSQTYATKEGLAEVAESVTTAQTDILEQVEDTYATKEALDEAVTGIGQTYSRIGHQHLTATIETVPGSGIITLTDNKTNYKKYVEGNTVIGFDATGLSVPNGETITFELLITMGPTAYNVLFGSNVTWINGDEPYFTYPNKSYLFAFRSYDTGNSWVGSYQGIF